MSTSRLYNVAFLSIIEAMIIYLNKPSNAKRYFINLKKSLLLARISMKLFVFLFLLCSIQLSWAKPLQVFVSVLPQKHFVEQVGGEYVHVSVMVQPGHSPATYEPSLKQMTKLSQADAYIRIGVPFENIWMPRLQKNNPQLRLVDARQGIELLKLAEHKHEGAHHYHHHHAHEEETLDPHVWLDPLLVVQMTQQIQQVLSELAPQQAAIFAQNAQKFILALRQLDRELHQQLKSVQGQRFLVFHPSWGYFAKNYGLQQIAIEKKGKSPGAKRLQSIIEQAKAADIRVIFVQQQFSQRDAKTVANAINGEVIAVDPLAENYVQNLRDVAQVFVKALR